MPKDPAAPQAQPRTPQHASGVHEGRQHRVAATPVTPVAVVPAPQPSSGELILSSSVVSSGDIGKCLREVGEIDDYFHQASIRGNKDQPLPTLGRVLDGLAQANGLNMIHADDRQKLKEFLTRLKAKAPVVHMSFPSEANDSFLAKILEWFRAEVHPHVVLHVGLQPELAAGCVVRTTNKSFDFSFRKRFEKSKQKLMQALETLDKKTSQTAPVPVGAAPAPSAVAPQPEGAVVS